MHSPTDSVSTLFPLSQLHLTVSGKLIKCELNRPRNKGNKCKTHHKKLDMKCVELEAVGSSHAFTFLQSIIVLNIFVKIPHTGDVESLDLGG